MKIWIPHEHFNISQNCKGSYVVKSRQPLEIMVGDFIRLKATMMRGISHFGLREKLAPRYTEPIEISERIDLLDYRLELSP